MTGDSGATVRPRPTRRPRLLTPAEAAGRLGLKEPTLRYWAHCRKIAHYKVGKSLRFAEDAIDELLDQCIVPAK